MSKPLTDEQVRILRAAREGWLRRAEDTQRWHIVGAARPNRRDRELLQKRGLLDYAFARWDLLLLTTRGRAELAAYEARA